MPLGQGCEVPQRNGSQRCATDAFAAREKLEIMQMPDAVHEDRLLYLFWLYVWPLTIFEDATRGTVEERWSKLRHNREKSRHLPHYAKVWLLIALLLFAFSSLIVEWHPFSMPALITGAIAGMLFTCAVVVLTVILVAYAWFHAMRP